MSIRLLCFLFLGLGLAGTGATKAQEAPKRMLFDGASFEGWEGDRAMFRIEEGALVAGTLDAQIPANAFLCTTEAFDDFDLRLQARILGPGDNGGIQFRSRRVPDHHEVSGYQADMGTVSRNWFYGVIGADYDENTPDEPASVWGALYDESRRNRYLAWSHPDDVTPALKPGDWNALRIRAEGPSIRIWVNDVPTVDYTETDHIPRSGVICLQVHSGPAAEIWHRELVLQPIR